MKPLVILALLLVPFSLFSQNGGRSPGIGGIPRLEQEPYYFATGFDFKDANGQYSNQVKYEIGVKYNALGFNLGPAPVDLMFQYHQVSFFHLWDKADSQPMYDHRFNFLTTLRVRLGDLFPYQIFSGFRFTPFHHESNGGGLATTRGWNRSAFGLDFGTVEDSLVAVNVFANVFVYDEEEANPGLEYYLGRGGLITTLNLMKILSYNKPNTWKLYTFGDGNLRLTWMWATQNMLNLKTELYFNPVTFWYKYFQGTNPNGIWSPSLYLQWYYGAGENLRDYRDVHNSIRMGFATAL